MQFHQGNTMIASYHAALGASVLLCLVSGAAIAAGDLFRQTPIEVTVDLGSPGKYEFAPKQLRFETGKLYKLILRNNSSDPHYFTSHAFSQMVWTRKAQVTQQRDGKSVVAQDNGSQTWNAWRNQYWPAQYIVDQSGKVVFQHAGEGQYEEIERTVARLLNASS
jgi:hypothetical protein